MDKTRIEEAAVNYANDNHKKIGLRTAAQLGFYAGADWASDTTWRDSSKEMPEEGVFVLGILERPYIEPTYILAQNVGGQFTMKGVNYWCPLPYFQNLTLTKNEEYLDRNKGNLHRYPRSKHICHNGSNNACLYRCEQS